MLRLTKPKGLKHFVLMLAFSLISTLQLYAQTAGSTSQYSYTDTNDDVVSPAWTVTSPQGTIISTSRVKDVMTLIWTYSATVRWDVIGPATVKFNSGSLTVRSWNVTIACPTMGIPTFGAQSTCSGLATTFTATPGSNGNTVYWYVSSSTGTAFNQVTTYPVTLSSSTTYYVSTYNTTSTCESSRVSMNVTVNQLPATPSSPTVQSNCGVGVLAIGSPPAGITWYWQDANTSGTSVTSYASTYPVSTSGPNYVRARDNSSGCWSTNSSSVGITIYPVPTISAVDKSICSGNSTGITLTNNVANTTNTWTVASTNVGGATNGSGISTSSSPFTYTLSQNLSATTTAVGTATYTISPSANGCTGTPINVTATVNPIPALSATGNNQIICSGQTTPINLSSSISGSTYSWTASQTNVSGASSTVAYTSSTSINQQIFATGTSQGVVAYGITASLNNCQSPQTNVQVYVNPLPPAPAAPTIPFSENPCGPRTMTQPNNSWGYSYWQTNSSDQFTSSSSPSITISASGTATYYLKAYVSGCWGPSSPAASVTVDNPPTANLSKTAYTFCESDVMTMSPTNTPAFPGMNWYDSSPTLVASAFSYTPINLNNGTYTYKVTNVSAGGCESITPVVVTVQVGGSSANCDNYLNWNETIAYTYANTTDQTPVVAADSKIYSDSFGKVIQSQAKSIANNQVFASESIYDRLGNQTLTTLPAPINSGNFEYRYRFTTNPSKQKYSWSDFDASSGAGSLNSPNAVANNGVGTLGWYYSSANNLEPNTPTTGYPYSRSYSPPSPNPTTSTSAGPGDAYKMGSGHESKSNRQLITAGELDHYYSLRSYFVSTPLPNALTNPAPTLTSVSGFSGKNLISGTGLVTVTPGSAYNLTVTGNTSSQAAYIYVGDAYGNNIIWKGPALPIGSSQTVSQNFVIPQGVTSIRLAVLWNGTSTDNMNIVSSTFALYKTPVANIGYKFASTDPDGKKAVQFVDAGGNAVATAVATVVSGSYPDQTYSYDNWSYNYYNDLGQLAASVAPNGVNTSSGAMPNFVTTYKYDHLGRLIETTSPDEGTSQFVYSTDGKIRFSQNQEQRNANPQRFSYTNYDYLGRLMESGEYTSSNTNPFKFEPSYTASPSQYSVLLIVDNNIPNGYDVETITSNSADASYFNGPSFKLDNARCADYTFIKYDLQPSDLPTGDSNHLSQNNLLGQVSKTWNANATTWYSYDEFGQVEWTKQNIAGLGIKTVDYTYDFLGNVTQVAYQNQQTAQTDKFYHHYTYNADNKLTDVATSFDGVAKTAQAKYKYYLHGPLKRVELATNLQGIDYVYTINGALKGINHADNAKDPGGDGANGFAPDYFGTTFNYFNNDYTGAGYNPGTFTTSGLNDYYGGQLKSATWHTQVDNQKDKKTYGYAYDNLNRFTNAQWGTAAGSVGNYTTTFSGANAYKEGIGGYDKNGNIQSLVRNGKTGNVLGNYTYNYTASKNQLASISGNATVNYAYNTIGQMTQQVEGTNTMKVTYNAYGLTKEVRDGSNNLMEQYFYDDRGDLTKKVIYNAGALLKTTYYARDASGNPLGIYEQNGANALALVEQPIYGSGRIGMMKPKGGQKKYFYELNDNLGNVRAVVGAPSTEVKTATYETANAASDQSNFLRYANARRINSILFDHTNGSSTGYAERLNGSANEKYGLARSLSVMPGDTVRMEVYAKYVDTNSADWTSTFNTLMGQITSNTAGVVVDGSSYPSSTSSFPFAGLLSTAGSTGTGPKAYLNWLIFDKNFAFVTGGYTRLSSTPKEYGQDVAHERMASPDIVVNDPGYMYIYLSNEETGTPVEVYFDDFKVTQSHSRIVAGGDYYPYGLTMDDRQITQERYRFGYQGQFAEYDSLTKTNTFQLRLYDPRFGRWLSADPYGQYSSPYVGMGNNPVSGFDPDGGWNWITAGIGFAVGGTVGYFASGGDWGAALAGGLAGGLLGGASYDRTPAYGASNYGYATTMPSKTVLNDFGLQLFQTVGYRLPGIAARELMTWEEAKKNMRGMIPKPENPNAITLDVDGDHALVFPTSGYVYKGSRRTRKYVPYHSSYNFQKEKLVPNKMKKGVLHVKIHGNWIKIKNYAVAQGNENESFEMTDTGGYHKTAHQPRERAKAKRLGAKEFRVVTPTQDIPLKPYDPFE